MPRITSIRFVDGGVCEVHVFYGCEELSFRLPCWLLSMKPDEIIFLDPYNSVGGDVVFRFYSMGKDAGFYEDVRLCLADDEEFDYGDLGRSLAHIFRKYKIKRVEVRAYNVSCSVRIKKMEGGLPESLESLNLLPF